MPQSVVDEAQRGVRWQRAYNVQTSEVAQWLGDFLSGGGAVTGEMVGILASLTSYLPNPIGTPADPDYPHWTRIESSMGGGEPMKAWLGKITASIEKSREAANEAALESVGYYTEDDLKRSYLGICDADDDCVIRSMVRVASGAPEDWQVWNGQEKQWDALDRSSIRKFEAVELDRDLVAFTAAALSEKGVEGVRLVFAAPSAYLPYTPVTAAAPADVTGTHYYAIVDATDTSAVMDLISISPGPVVMVRDKGQWTDGSKTLQLLTGINPPPLVELDDKTLKLVMAQIDGTYNAAATNPDYVESLGNEPAIEQKKKDDFAQQQAEFAARRAASTAAKPSNPVTAALAALHEERDSTLQLLRRAIEGARIEEVNRRGDFDQHMVAVRAGGAVDEDGLEADHRNESARRKRSAALVAGLEREYALADLRYRRRIAEESLRASAAARTRLAALETLSEAVSVSASGAGWGDSEVLRQYHTKEAGALKVKWGVNGDAVRCVRHVSKYVGLRALAICSERTS